MFYLLQGQSSCHHDIHVDYHTFTPPACLFITANSIIKHLKYSGMLPRFLFFLTMLSYWSNMTVARSDEALNDAPTFLDLDSVPPLQILYCVLCCEQA